MTHGESRSGVNVGPWSLLCGFVQRDQALLPRDLSAALHLCCVSVPSEASRTLPSLESIQKVFEQQLHPNIHQRSQVSQLEGGRRSRDRSAGAVSMRGGGFWLHRGDRWGSGDQSPPSVLSSPSLAAVQRAHSELYPHSFTSPAVPSACSPFLPQRKVQRTAWALPSPHPTSACRPGLYISLSINFTQGCLAAKSFLPPAHISPRTFFSLPVARKTKTPGLLYVEPWTWSCKPVPQQQADSPAWPAASNLWTRFANLSFCPPIVLHVQPNSVLLCCPMWVRAAAAPVLLPAPCVRCSWGESAALPGSASSVIMHLCLSLFVSILRLSDARWS